MINPIKGKRNANQEKMLLQPAHRFKLKESALSDQQIDKLLWRSTTEGNLLIPYLTPEGKTELCNNGSPFQRLRLSPEEIEKNPKGGKYRSPKGNGCRIYHSHLAIAAGSYQEKLADRYTPLRITEGEAKTESAAIHDRHRLTIGIGGVSSWQDRRDGGEESSPLKEFEEIPLDGREVRLCFDSDLDKPQVANALKGIAEMLADRGAHVLIEILPTGLDGQRLGLDDLIYRHGPTTFLEIAAIARSPFKSYRRNGEVIRKWDLKVEPEDTHERNTYLSGMIGREWRCGEHRKDHWQHWNGTYWQDIFGDDAIARELERFAVLQDWKNRELTTLRSLQAAFRRSIQPVATGRSNPGLLPFKNGCLVLDRLEFIPHSPVHNNSWALPYEYREGATCERTESFLLDRLRDPASVAVFRAFMREILTGGRLKCFLEITGPSNSGKSVIARLLEAVVGRENTVAGTLQRLEDRSQRFETAKLVDRRLAIFAECQDYSGPLQNLKALTGGDTIPAEIKGGRHFDFRFTGGLVLVGNGPIRCSDPSGAVINRRRSLIVPEVVPAGQERQLLEFNECGNWEGELAEELAGLVNWALAMPAAEAREALARDVQSIARAEAKLEIILSTDHLAEWADQYLIWAPERKGNKSMRVGMQDGDPDLFLFPSYIRFMRQQGLSSRSLSLKIFKGKLVDLLRDTHGLPMPSGSPTCGEYRIREMGSVVPCLRWRESTDAEAPGVIRHAVMTEAGMDSVRIGKDKIAAGNECNGRSSAPCEQQENSYLDMAFRAYRHSRSTNPGPTVPSVPYQPSDQLEPSAPSLRSIPHRVSVEVENVKTGEWEVGWLQVGIGKGSTTVLCIDPNGHSRQVERRRIREIASLRSGNKMSLE